MQALQISMSKTELLPQGSASQTSIYKHLLNKGENSLTTQRRVKLSHNCERSIKDRINNSYKGSEVEEELLYFKN